MARSKRWFVMVQATPEEKEEYKKVANYEGHITLSGWFRFMAKKAVAKWKKGAGMTLLVLLCASRSGLAAIDQEKLCQAIYHAEGESKTKHPYGIMQKYKTTTPKQACINTVNSAIKRYKTDSKGLDFISFLGSTYAPLNAKNDPSGLNKNWINNVRRLYVRRAV